MRTLRRKPWAAAVVAVLLGGCAHQAVVGQSVPVEAQPARQCWLGEVTGPNFGNVLSICNEAGVATVSNYFRNPGGFPTTCDSDGVSRANPGGGLDFAFDKGECENGRPTNPFGLSCAAGEGESLACRFVANRNLQDVYIFNRVIIGETAATPGDSI